MSGEGRLRIVLELGRDWDPVAERGGTLAVAACRWMDVDASLAQLRRVFASHVRAMHPGAEVRTRTAAGDDFACRIEGVDDAEAADLAEGIEEMLTALVRTATEWRVMLN